MSADLSRAFKLLFASDLHLGAAGRSIAGDLAASAARENPDLIVLGGDLIDRSRGLRLLPSLIASLLRVAPVAAIAGNHDRFAGVEEVRRVVTAAGATWLPDGPVTLAGVVVEADESPARDPHSGFRVLCAHDPEAIESSDSESHDLILAGHLHGGQIVAFRHRGREFPGAWFYRWNGPRFRRGATTMLVSRGCADTLPIRWRCPREVIACEIGGA